MAETPVSTTATVTPAPVEVVQASGPSMSASATPFWLTIHCPVFSRPQRLLQLVSALRTACIVTPASRCAQRTSGSARSSPSAAAASAAGTDTTSVSGRRRLRSWVTPASARTSARSAAVRPASRRITRSTVSAAWAAAGVTSVSARQSAMGQRVDMCFL